MKINSYSQDGSEFQEIYKLNKTTNKTFLAGGSLAKSLTFKRKAPIVNHEVSEIS